MSDTYNIGPTVPSLFAAHDRRYAEAQERIAGLRAALAELKAENERFSAALRFYSNTDTYRTATVYMCGHGGERLIDYDKGKKARAALAAAKEEQ